MRRFTAILAGLCLASFAHADDFTKALEKQATIKARRVVSDLIEIRASGKSWPVIAEKSLPEMLDERCGYEDLVGISSNLMGQMRPEVLKVAGGRLSKLYAPLLSRLGAQMAFTEVKSSHTDKGDYALVVLKVTPAKAGDKPFSLLMRHNPDGTINLCDVVPDSNFGSGILKTIGTELAANPNGE
ncbi:hypothetical protein HNP46_000238 [Pseudomonas nitritireducens]|uniref:DUF4252 domain-containing protein n=1 Tax=Pseudomonas nitroreducens TaxID=46680 RepID=A0A7W7NZP5_PSENT|nr:hypothetical protein [Pseudomonas nitritireducens]MBB4861427.1 hypothetical protein [Pseudomonas nitritireducens]